MPGFAGHTLANSLVLVGTSAILADRGWPVASIIAVDVGIAISTLVLSPDMDLFTSKPMEEWGILKYFWWPYARLVKHRDRLHTPILGTTVRWMYLLILVALLVLAVRLLLRLMGADVSLTYQGDLDNLLRNLRVVIDLYIGANIADAVHFLLDMSTHGLEHGTARYHSHSPRTRYQHGARKY